MSNPSPDPTSAGFTCTRRRFLRWGGVAAAGLAMPRFSPAAPARQTPAPRFPQLAGVGERFTFGLIADTHFGSLEAGAAKARFNNAMFRRMAGEINALQPAAAFVVHVGDVIASPTPERVAAAKTLLRDYKGKAADPQAGNFSRRTRNGKNTQTDTIAK